MLTKPVGDKEPPFILLFPIVYLCNCGMVAEILELKVGSDLFCFMIVMASEGEIWHLINYQSF